jgi:hypothetical protein
VCVIEVTINTHFFIYYPLLEDVLFTATCFGSVEPSSGNIHMILRKIIISIHCRYNNIYKIICILPKDSLTKLKHVAVKRMSSNKGYYIKSVV